MYSARVENDPRKSSVVSVGLGPSLNSIYASKRIGQNKQEVVCSDLGAFFVLKALQSLPHLRIYKTF